MQQKKSAGRVLKIPCLQNVTLDAVTLKLFSKLLKEAGKTCGASREHQLIRTLPPLVLGMLFFIFLPDMRNT